MSKPRQLIFGLLICGLLPLGAAAACDKTTPGGPDPDPGPAPSSPSARRHSGIAYDAARQRVLLFGGVDNSNTELTDLWSWNGNAWTRLSARTGGGEIGTEIFATALDVFSFSPTGRVQRLVDTQWIQVTAASTPDRTGASYAYDSVRGRLVRFGGGASPGQAARETWEFDGQSWTLASSQGPSARLHPAMAYDPQRRVTVLYGGVNQSDQKLGDTWEWDGFEWTQISAPGPSPRLASTMVFDGGAGEMLLFGGIDATTLHVDELWRRRNGEWSRVSASSGPAPRSLSLMAFDGARGNILLFGGDGGVASLGDTWTWSGQAWTAR